MAPTQMKLRVRRRGSVAADAAAEGGRPEEDEDRSRPGGARSSRRKSSSSRAWTAEASPSPPGSSSVAVAEDASPDSKCPICLDRFNNLAYLDRCLHRFCFPCIQEWSHNKAECPLCKQPFASILHSVRAEDDFKEYTLQPAPTSSSVAATVAMVAAMASAARSNHQMRMMLRRHRGGDAAERRRRRERRGRRRSSSRTGDGLAVDEWFLDSSLTLPPLPPLPSYPPASPLLSDNSEEVEGAEEQRASDGAASPDGGVIFEGMMRLGGAVLPLASSSRDSRRMLAQLAARRRMQQESGSAGRVRERETVAFRRDLYRCGIRVSRLQGQQQQRDLSADSFRRSPELLSRLGPWLRRELGVLYGAHGSLAHIVQRIIMARLARRGLEDTPTVEEELRPFLLARTDHFLHELVSFARSPLSLESYDLQAVYEPPPSAQLEAISSSSDRESVIAISEGEEERGLPGGERGGAEGGGDVLVGRSSQSAWDEQAAGPSHSTAEPSCSLSPLSFSPAQHEAANEEDGEKEEEEEEEECLIVGYKKPIAERTPELVQLSSDSEEEGEEEKKEERKLPASPRTTPPLLHLPIIPPSTSGTHGKEQEEELKEKDGEQTCSGRSRKSPCGPQQQQQGEERRRQRRRSGTLFNPNRCIYPGLMHHPSRSSSPSQSSGESSPPDSSWEYSCSLASPLASSLSSPSRMSWSSSPPLSPPQTSEQSPAPPLAPPSAPPGERGEKPGGKRKYKSRHLDSGSQEPSWKQRRSSHRRQRRRERKKKERRRRRPRPEGRRRERAPRSGQGGGRRSREERSPSVEIVYEGPLVATATPTAHRRRWKQQPRTPAGSCPIIITLDSDGSQDGPDGRPAVHQQTLDLSHLLPVHQQTLDLSHLLPVHQQTLDLSHLLPVPLLLPDDVCQSTQAEGGGAAGETVTRGSPELDQESPGLDQGSPELDQGSPRQPQDSSDHDVDVETVEGQHLLLGSEEVQRSEVRVAHSHGASASRLLASILGDVQVVSQPKWTDGRRPSASPVGDRGPDVSRPLPELPPLLQQVSPVRWSSRDTPPPLSPRLSHLAPAACSTNHKPRCPPGPGPQSVPRGANIPSAHSQSTSTERRKQRSNAPPGGHGGTFLEDFAPSGDRGTDGRPSSVLLVSSQTPSRAAAGAAMDTGAPSLAQEDTAPPKSTLWMCPPFVQHAALSSSACPGESKLSGASSDSQPAVGSH